MRRLSETALGLGNLRAAEIGSVRRVLTRGRSIGRPRSESRRHTGLKREAPDNGVEPKDQKKKGMKKKRQNRMFGKVNSIGQA